MMVWGERHFRPCGACGGEAYGGTIEVGPSGKPRLICRHCLRKFRLEWEREKAAGRGGDKS